MNSRYYTKQCCHIIESKSATVTLETKKDGEKTSSLAKFN